MDESVNRITHPGRQLSSLFYRRFGTFTKILIRHTYNKSLYIIHKRSGIIFFKLY